MNKFFKRINNTNSKFKDYGSNEHKVKKKKNYTKKTLYRFISLAHVSNFDPIIVLFFATNGPIEKKLRFVKDDPFEILNFF